VQRLQDAAYRLGIELDRRQIQQFRSYREGLIAWNQRVNLTAVTDPGEIEKLHFVDSLTLALAVPESVLDGGSIGDVGTGAGFPGVPLKVAFPGIKLTLVDSIAKRTRYLGGLAQDLGLEGVRIVTGRAETLGHDTGLRESMDVVVSRAVASMRVLVELVLPFCRVGGRVVLQKKGDIREELEQAGNACRELGGRVVEVKPVPAEVLDGQRVLVVVEKVAATPARYPRRAGIPAKRPL
jgi:16S rRNA (guanine527-N7)-methyltransferase